MSILVARRTFVARTFAATTALLGANLLVRTAAASSASIPADPSRPTPLELALVKEFVVAGHTNIPRVKELLAFQPALINAVWDWGDGDFECALNGASHLGRRDVALFLLESGARLDAPCAAMLGETDIITALLRLSPAAANSRGAHGFSLLYHAAHSGKVAIAEALSPHLTTRNGDSNQALIPASLAGHAEFVAWLLANGVDDPNAKNFQGKTALDLALQWKHDHVAHLLRNAGGITTR